MTSEISGRLRPDAPFELPADRLRIIMAIARVCRY